MSRMIALVAVALAVWGRRPSEPRLLGAWRSDGARTVAEVRRTRRLPEGALARPDAMFGKLTVTYAAASYTTELDGLTKTAPYEVLGSNRATAVIRDLAPPREPDLGSSRFTVIQFEGPDAYWLDPALGGFREYFRRVGP